jgi:hypothetical protein
VSHPKTGSIAADCPSSLEIPPIQGEMLSEPRVPVCVRAVSELSPIELKKLKADLDLASLSGPKHLSSSRFEIAMLLAQSVVVAADSGNLDLYRRRLGLFSDVGASMAHGVVDALRTLAADYSTRGHLGMVWAVMCLMSAIEVRMAEVQVEIAQLEAKLAT